MTQEPLDTRCVNAGEGVGWTCPGCYTDFGDRDHSHGIFVCQECNRRVRLTEETQPLYVAELVGDDENE